MAGGASTRVLGPYEIFEEIASGGMATVHLGRALGTDRFVAVKRMHTQFAKDADFRSMFLDEARLCAFVEHENVGRTLDVVDADGELLLILELVHGESLSRLAKQVAARGSRVPLAVTGAVVVQALRGLQAAHDAVGESGEPLYLVHRDVSPHNVLVGSDGVVKVVDFGVAKARGRVQQTAQGQIKGKLAYMSPEQARGKPVDARSDVFAAGIVLWELLAGKRLFEGDNEAHVLTQLLTERPARLADVDPSLAPYDALVARALSVEPADRYASALAMAEAIEATLPVATREELARWVSEEAGEVLRRRRDVIARHTSDAEAATKVDASSAPVAPPATTPIAVTGGSPPAPGQLPPSALMTQRLDPADRPSIDAALPHYLQRGGPSGRPSDAPPAQSQVTKVALTTNDLPPPLPEERVRQLVGIGVGTAVTVAAMLASVLVVAKHSPPPPSSAVRAGLALAAHVVPRVTRASSESASPSTAASAPSASSSTAASATASAIAPTPKPPVPQAPRPAPKPGTAKPAGPTRSTSPAPPKKTR